MADPLSTSEISAACGISPSYVSMILNNRRTPPRHIALRLYKATGRKFGPIAGLSDEDIATLARIEGIAA